MCVCVCVCVCEREREREREVTVDKSHLTCIQLLHFTLQLNKLTSSAELNEALRHRRLPLSIFGRYSQIIVCIFM